MRRIAAAVQRHFERLCERRVRERTRAARELNDTLVQNFQGVLLKFHAATSLLPERPDEARGKLEEALAQADQAVTEARDAMQRLPGSE